MSGRPEIDRRPGRGRSAGGFPGRRNSGSAGRRGKSHGKLIGLFLALILLGAGGYFYVRSLAYKVCRVEAGNQVVPSDFLKKPDEEAVFAPGSDPFDITVPGEYQIKVKSGLFTHKCKLIIEDTRKPEGKAVDVRLALGNTCGPESFVTDIADATKVTVSYGAQPDFTKKGDQRVQIVLTDLGNNSTVLEAGLYMSIVPDMISTVPGLK